MQYECDGRMDRRVRLIQPDKPTLIIKLKHGGFELQQKILRDNTMDHELMTLPNTKKYLLSKLKN